MLDKIIDMLLLLGNHDFLVGFIIFGICFVNRKAFVNSLLITIFASVLNAYLKYYFKIPMNPLISKTGWAYPSGHTVTNIVFWGSLFIQIKQKWIAILAGIIICTILPSMVYKGYHTWIDIFGGIYTAGIILIIFYYWILYSKGNKIVVPGPTHEKFC